ncbi:unnamed protein product [Rotaria sp. Silwood1]|nr:unnamed protein product [Rotaria sp. Silwood1]CAF3674585.1 unnamed protein product [Rotaria sp. Silwood1]CAF4803526.1 unnamed protein product [Rotaria sp. Silwood1]
MEYDDVREQNSEIIQRLDPQLIVNCVTEALLLYYNIFLLNYVYGFEADETNELISYVDLLETILAEKEDNGSMNTTSIPKESPSSTPITLKLLRNFSTDRLVDIEDAINNLIAYVNTLREDVASIAVQLKPLLKNIKIIHNVNAFQNGFALNDGTINALFSSLKEARNQLANYVRYLKVMKQKLDRNVANDDDGAPVQGVQIIDEDQTF